MKGNSDVAKSLTDANDIEDIEAGVFLIESICMTHDLREEFRWESSQLRHCGSNGGCGLAS